MRILCFILALIAVMPGSPVTGQEGIRDQPSHSGFSERVAERERLVDQEIAGYPYQPVRDPGVLKAMKKVPRHLFVPEQYRADAYRNSPLYIGHNQTISQPYIVAHMTELLALEPGDRVLEIGTGSGYQAAVLAELCKEVYSIEIIPPLARKADSLLNELGYTNVHVRTGDGYEGWPGAAPFEGIIVTCAPEAIPQPLVDQLANGGRIVIPVGGEWEVQQLVVVRKDRNGKISSKRQYPVRFVPMTGKAREKKP